MPKSFTNVKNNSKRNIFIVVVFVGKLAGADQWDVLTDVLLPDEIHDNGEKLTISVKHVFCNS